MRIIITIESESKYLLVSNAEFDYLEIGVIL